MTTFHFVPYSFAAVTDIDTSGIQALEELYKSLHKKDIQVILIPYVQDHFKFDFMHVTFL